MNPEYFPNELFTRRNELKYFLKKKKKIDYL